MARTDLSLAEKKAAIKEEDEKFQLELDNFHTAVQLTHQKLEEVSKDKIALEAGDQELKDILSIIEEANGACRSKQHTLTLPAEQNYLSYNSYTLPSFWKGDRILKRDLGEFNGNHPVGYALLILVLLVFSASFTPSLAEGN